MFASVAERLDRERVRTVHALYLARQRSQQSRRLRPRSSAAGWPCPPPSARAGPHRRTPTTMRSEQPFITCGIGSKSGVTFTKPLSFTTRLTRSRSPPHAALHLREQIERAEPRGGLALLHFDGVAELALDAAGRIDRDLPRHVHEIADDHERHIGGHRRRRRRQRDAQFLQARFNPASSSSSLPASAAALPSALALHVVIRHRLATALSARARSARRRGRTYRAPSRPPPSAAARFGVSVSSMSPLSAAAASLKSERPTPIRRYLVRPSASPASNSRARCEDARAQATSAPAIGAGA